MSAHDKQESRSHPRCPAFLETAPSARYLDKNLADPHRYSGSRATTKARLLALDLDPVRLAEANAHRIPVYTDESRKKINPLKASKRGLKG